MWTRLAIFAGVFAALTLNITSARAEEDPGIYIYHWPTWQSGVDLGMMALGHFGKGDSLNSPPGGLGIRAQGHYWYDHLIEFHLTLGLGVTSSSFLAGAGLKLNILEYVDDVSGNIHAKGIQRGLLSRIIPNFMLFFSLDLDHYSFPKPDPALGLTYNTSPTPLVPGLGAQWYFYVRNSFARRFYLETSIGYTVISSNNFVLPFLGFGAELK